MTQPTIKFKKLHEQAIIPQYQTPGSAGLDLHWDGRIGDPLQVCTDDEIHDRLWIDQIGYLLGTGLAVEIPEGYEGQIRPRSSLGKNSLHVFFGTIDQDYRGELKVRMQLLRDGDNPPFMIAKGDRIAQLVIAPVARCVIQVAEGLSATERGAGGFGSTGR